MIFLFLEFRFSGYYISFLDLRKMSKSPKSPKRGLKRSQGTMNFPSLSLSPFERTPFERPPFERQPAFHELSAIGTPANKETVTITTFTIGSTKNNESPKRPGLKRGKPAYSQKKTSTPSPTQKKKSKRDGGKRKQTTKKHRS